MKQAAGLVLGHGFIAHRGRRDTGCRGWLCGIGDVPGLGYFSAQKFPSHTSVHEIPPLTRSLHKPSLDGRLRPTRKAVPRAYLVLHPRRSQQKCIRHIIFLRLRDEHDHRPLDTPATANPHLFVAPLAQSAITDIAARSTASCVPHEGARRIGRGRESGPRSRVGLIPQTRPPALQIAQTVEVAESVCKHALVRTGFRVWGDPRRGILFHRAYSGHARLLWPS